MRHTTPPSLVGAALLCAATSHLPIRQCHRSCRGWLCHAARQQSLRMRSLLLLVASAASLSLAPPEICVDGVWNEASNSVLEAAQALPHLQCWRKPPCARWSYATPERCRAMPNDEDWPTWDPHLGSNPPGQHSFASLLETHWRNKTVVLVGDSINSLVFNAALCEAAKAFDLQAGPTLDPHQVAAVTAHMKRYHEGMLAVLRGHDARKHGDLWVGGPPQRATMVPQTNTLLVMKGWHKWGRRDMAAVLNLTDVVLLNYGLHYEGNVSEYREAMPQMLDQLSAWAAEPSKSALFRETGAEHMNVAENDALLGGFLDSERGHPDGTKVAGCQCQQRPATQPSLARLLNAMVRKLLPLHPAVGTVPFYNLTLPRHDMHEAGFCAFEGLRGKQPEKKPPYCCDCTHLCYTPQLWKAFFSSVHDQMDLMAARRAAV